MAESVLSASSSGERRRIVPDPAPRLAWDPAGATAASVAPALWDALRESVLWAETEWERVVEHAAGVEEAIAHLAQLSAAIRQEAAGVPANT